MADSPHKPSDGGGSEILKYCDRHSKREANKDTTRNRGHPLQGTCYGLDRVQVLSIYLSCEVGTVIEPILQPGKQRLSKLALAPKAGIRI